jgi:hypothetical protein
MKTVINFHRDCLRGGGQRTCISCVALYRLRCYDGDWLVVTAKLAAESLARPIQADLAVGDIDYICDSA